MAVISESLSRVSISPLATALLTQKSPVVFGDDGISDASRELRALAILSGSLTDPLTPEDAAIVVERQALAVLGATSAVIVTLGEFPGVATIPMSSVPVPVPTVGARPEQAEALILVHAIGVKDHLAAALQQLELDALVPLAEVARTGEPIFLCSESELRKYPAWCDAILTAGTRAAAAVPVWANGHLRGVLGLTWSTPRAFEEDERAFVLTLGVMCAQAILRGHLKVAEFKAREAAEHANRAKTQFLRTMSHELRTPLTAVLGYTELLADEIVGPVTPVQKDHLRRILRSSNHLLSLIEEVLRFAQLDSGEEEVHAEQVLAHAMVTEACEMIMPMASEKGILIRCTPGDESISLDTDRIKLQQILVNLVTNAVKYTDLGEVHLAVDRSEVGGVPMASFIVTDSGRGIAEEDQQHIFEVFWQVHQLSLRPSSGSGLGLAVARQLARFLGGDVVLSHSQIESGSTFILSLPIDRPVTMTKTGS